MNGKYKERYCMKQADIISELDALKLKIMIEGVQDEKSDLDRYDEWLDEIMGRKISRCRWDVRNIFDATQYATCRTVASLVQDLFYKKYSSTKCFHEDREEITRMIREAVFMTMYVQKQI